MDIYLERLKLGVKIKLGNAWDYTQEEGALLLGFYDIL